MILHESSPQKPEGERRRRRQPSEPAPPPTWIEVDGEGNPTGAVVSRRHPLVARDGCRWAEATPELLAGAFER